MARDESMKRRRGGAVQWSLGAGAPWAQVRRRDACGPEASVTSTPTTAAAEQRAEPARRRRRSGLLAVDGHELSAAHPGDRRRRRLGVSSCWVPPAWRRSTGLRNARRRAPADHLHIDGARGRDPRYRGAIEGWQVLDNFLEMPYLLINGSCPTVSPSRAWAARSRAGAPARGLPWLLHLLPLLGPPDGDPPGRIAGRSHLLRGHPRPARPTSASSPCCCWPRCPR